MCLPQQGLPGVETGSLLKLNKSAYGLSDAPRSWWLRFKTVLEEAGWIESDLDRGSFRLYDHGELVGVGGPHVDDFIVTGFGAAYERSLSKLKKSVSWGKWNVDSFVHCGRRVEKCAKTGDVVIDQDVYISKLPRVNLTVSRGDSPATNEEYEQARTSLGGVGWAAKQSQPQAAFDASVLLSELPKKRRETLRKVNKTVETLQSAPMKIRFPASLPLTLDGVSVIVFSDASWGNRSDGTSQGGYLVGLMDKKGLQGGEAPFGVLMWSSHKVRRVCRSTLSAESQAACISTETGDFLRVLLLETLCPDFVLGTYAQRLPDVSAALVLDAKSVYDHVVSDNGKHPGDKRLAVDLRVLHNYLRKGQWNVKWVCGPQMLGDVLTKHGADPSHLSWVLGNGRCTLTLDARLQGKVQDCLRTWQQQVVERNLDDKELAAKKEQNRHHRMARKAANNKSRKQAVQEMIAQAKGNYGIPVSPAKRLKGRCQATGAAHKKSILPDRVCKKLTSVAAHDDSSVFYSRGWVKGLVSAISTLITQSTAVA